MAQLRPVSQTERILFPILVTIVGGLLVLSATPGSSVLQSLAECKVVERLSQTAEQLINIVTIHRPLCRATARRHSPPTLLALSPWVDCF